MRRRAPKIRRGARTGDIKKDLSAEQLAGIGAVALAWNEIEYLVDVAVGDAITLPLGMLFHVTSRLAFDAKKALLYEIAAEVPLPQPTLDLIKAIQCALGEYKNYRDAVVHARIRHAPTGIGEVIKRGAQTWQSLLTKEALDAFYERLDILWLEVEQIKQIFFAIRRFKTFGFRSADDQETRSLEQDSLTWTETALQHQSKRLALGPLPKFPQ